MALQTIFAEKIFPLPEEITIASLLEYIRKLEARIEALERENIELRARLEKYEHPKNSQNSSIPPSKDENRPKKNTSLREKSDKKPGGQPNHEGKTLEMTDNPDKVEMLMAEKCESCGKDLTEIPETLAERRQQLDLPPIFPIITEYQSILKICSCGHENRGLFPEGVTPGISYGPFIESLVAYFHAGQYIPYERMAELFNDMLNVPISEGSIRNLLDRFYKKASAEHDRIHDFIEKSETVGSDETGARINGEKGWFWTFQNTAATYILASFSRGYKTIQEYFKDGFENAKYNSDRWGAHLKIGVWLRQLCTSHLLRDAKYLIERFNSTWVIAFRQLLYDALDLKAALKEEEFYAPNVNRSWLLKRLNGLLDAGLDAKKGETITFRKKMKKYRDCLLNFLYFHDLPPDNNGSERAIRNIKVKQKVSGQFKSLHGAQVYATIRSVVDTARKNGLRVLHTLHRIANFEKNVLPLTLPP